MARTHGSRNSLPMARSAEIWRKLLAKDFDWATSWYNAFIQLDDPRDQISALKMVGEFFLPKPRAIEDELDIADDTAKLQETHALLRRLTEERLKRECQSGLQSDSEPSVPSSPRELLTALSKQS